MFQGRRTKKWIRSYYAFRTAVRLKRSLHAGTADDDYWQAGKSVAGINGIRPVAEIVSEFAEAWRRTR
jgi:nitronate monooxygenase